MEQASEHALNDVDPRLWSLKLREDDRGPAEDDEDKVLSFAPTGRDRALDLTSNRTPAARRDWSAAIELVREASEAIRVSEERATELEARTQELLQRFREELKSAQARIAASERRADEAEMRARDAEARMRDAEEWLERFHDAILDGFTPHVAGSPGRDTDEVLER